MLDFTFATAREIRTELARRLKAQRIHKGISQPELALRAGVALGTVSGFEKEGKVTVDTMLRLVMALGMTQELQSLFARIPQTIKEMEDAQKPARQRVARKKKLP
jgi:transcriptional regulator with XRE-family HTH domain